jgi:hypothetical protein
MKWSRILLLCALTAALAQPAAAGWFFNRKKDKPVSPGQRVMELVSTLKADGDENKRSAAAEELRQFDPTAHPEVVPALVEALMQDSKASVRAEAAQSLGKLRPVNPQAGKALEHAVANDSAMRVRWQARSSLLMYGMAGYHGGKKDEVLGPQTKEPPLADPEPPTIQTNPTSPLNTPPPPTPVRPPVLEPIPVPPLPLQPTPSGNSSVPQPLPQGPPTPPGEQGPELTPQPF